jgi:protein-tyrosine kinase
MSRIDEALRRAHAGGMRREATAAPLRAEGEQTALARMGDYVAEDPFQHEQAPAARAIAAPAAPMPAATSVLSAPTTVTRTAPTVTGRLISDPETSRASVEQYRRLATSLHQLQMERGVKSVMVTSAVPREGKTLTSANLALALSQSYNKRVLLIDCDLRRPSVHTLFGLPNATGLSDGLLSAAGTLPIIDVGPRLMVLPAGRPDPNPFAGFASERMSLIVKEAVGQFDWVILDTAPVMVAPDVSLMANLVDGVVMVIGANATAYKQVEKSIADIGHDRIIGVVLNGIEPSMLPAEYYGGGYYGDDALEASS